MRVSLWGKIDKQKDDDQLYESNPMAHICENRQNGVSGCIIGCWSRQRAGLERNIWSSSADMGSSQFLGCVFMTLASR